MTVASPGPLQFHEIANLFPMMPEAEQDQLGADMDLKGTLNKIVMHEGKILDGRNRYCQIVKRDMDPPSADWRGDDRFIAFDKVSKGVKPLDWVISQNLPRRHMSEPQRAMVAARISDYRQGRPAKSAPEPDDPRQAQDSKPANLPVSKAATGLTQGEAAEALHVSERSVRSARKVIETGSDELVDAVDKGTIAISAAEAIASLPAEQQIELVRQADPKVFARVAKERRAKTQAEKKQRRQERQRSMGKADLAGGERLFPVILSDPEWPWAPWGENGMDRSEENHYPTSSLEEIAARPIASIAETDTVLFCWLRPGMARQCVEVIEDGWGFKVVAEGVWIKDRIGKGFWLRNRHENFVIATRGEPPCPAMGDNWDSVIEAPRGEHSSKPVQLHEMIEAYFPDAPKIELNRRGVPRDGWWAWGNEVAADPARGITVDDNGFADASHLPHPVSAGGATHDPVTSLADIESVPGSSVAGTGAGGSSPGEGAAEKRTSGSAAPDRKGRKKGQRPPCFELVEDGIKALAVVDGDKARFYAVEKTPFFAEAGMIEMDWRYHDGQGEPLGCDADDDAAGRARVAELAGALLLEMSDEWGRDFIPTTIYRLGRTGPVPVREGGDTSTSFRVHYDLVPVLRAIGAETVELGIADPGSPVVIIGAGFTDRKAVVMPVRIANT